MQSAKRALLLIVSVAAASALATFVGNHSQGQAWDDGNAPFGFVNRLAGGWLFEVGFGNGPLEQGVGRHAELPSDLDAADQTVRSRRLLWWSRRPEPGELAVLCFPRVSIRQTVPEEDLAESHPKALPIPGIL